VTLAPPPCDRSLPRAGTSVRGDVEKRPDRPTSWRARVRWMDPATGRRRSLSRSFRTEEAAWGWVSTQIRTVEAGLDHVAMRVVYLAALAAHEHGLVLDATPGPCRVCTALEVAHRFITDQSR
jgi:hypothetical protein